MNRNKLNSSHPVIGEGYSLLKDNDTLMEFDETACMSELFNPNYSRGWLPVSPEWKDEYGKTIKDVCENGPDIDGWERVFRRKTS